MALAITVLNNVGYDGGGKRHKVIADLVYTAQAYSSGLSVPKGNLGMPNVLESLVVLSATPGDTNQYKYDASSEKIRIFAETAETDTQYEEVSGDQTVTIRVEALGW